MKRLLYFTNALLFILIVNINVFGQDGEAIFKSKCSACHILGKDGTGPNLKGVKQKWTDAGEGDLLSEWVKNSTALIAGGKSTMANTIKTYSPMEMPAQEVTPADVDAILTFVDGYVETAAPVASTTNVGSEATTPKIKYLPNYKENLTKFYWLLVAILILILGIFMMSSSIMNLTKSDYFQNKLAEKKDKEKNDSSINTTLIAIIGMFGLMALNNHSLALSFMTPGEAKENTPWLLVETSDLYFLAVINLILLGVVFYLKNMFKNLMDLVKTEQEKTVIAKPKRLKKINHVLTDVVPIEQEH